MESYAPMPSRREPRDAPARSNLTDRLFYSWERLHPAQRENALAMVEMSRAAMARQRRRRAMALLFVVAAVATAALLYLVVAFPA